MSAKEKPTAASRDNGRNPRQGLAVLRDIVTPEKAKLSTRENSGGSESGRTQVLRIVFRDAREMMDMA